MSDEQLKELPETIVLFLIRDIYMEENRLRNLSADERLTLRQEKVGPLVDRFFNYIHELDQSDEVFSDRMTKAINYAVNQEEYLRVFLTDGNISCDNGNAERIIRSYSIGRANWLFADTILGAEVNALMYSIVETAKANAANVLIYLRYLLEKMPAHALDTDRSYLAKMVPWSDAYRKYEGSYKLDHSYMLQNLFTEPARPRTPLKAEVSESYMSTSA